MKKLTPSFPAIHIPETRVRGAGRRARHPPGYPEVGCDRLPEEPGRSLGPVEIHSGVIVGAGAAGDLLYTVIPGSRTIFSGRANSQEHGG
jgi:hypothetical protein